MAAKTHLRQTYLQRRRVIPADLQDTTRWKVINHLRALRVDSAAEVVAVYMPMRGEIDILPWVQELWQQGITVALPRVVARQFPLVFNIWHPGSMLERDLLGIPAANGEAVQPALIIAPTLAYNRQGYRLGYGGGYYDITLKHQRQLCLTAGVAYTELELEQFPRQYHDQPLDYMVTGKEIITCYRF